MRYAQFSIVSLAIAYFSACTSRGRIEPGEGSVPEQTSYEFTATVPFSDNVTRATRTLELSGVLVRLGDSLFVHPKANCQLLSPETPAQRMPKGMPIGANFVRVYCQGAYLAFNRVKPSSAKWYTWYSRPETREVCEQYGTRAGRQVCLRSDMRTFYNTETRSGSIKVKQLGQR